MRAAMPTVTAFVDALRDTGLTDNETLREGLQHGGFWASEGGEEIGKRGEWEEGVQPVLSDAAESRLADLWWKRRNG